MPSASAAWLSTAGRGEASTPLCGGSSRHGPAASFDVNLRPPFVQRATIAASLERANVLKLNDQGVPVLASLFGLGTLEAEQPDGTPALTRHG